MSEVFKINEIDYDCDFVLTNADDQEVSFTKSAIRGMTIVDNFFDPFISGSISIANPYDFIENEYFIRGDGRDKFKIMFGPVDKDEKVEHDFVIVGEGNNVNPRVRSENMKTFKLVDAHAIPFSDTIPHNKKYSGLIGDILKDVFKEVLGEELVDEDNWESGDFQLEYIPPLSFRYVDLIHYLMRLYYAKDGDLHVKGFISFDLSTGKFRMDLLSKLFEDNKKNVFEAFGMGDLTDKITFDNPNNPPADAETGEYIGALKNIGYNTPQYGWNNDFFINCLVHGYDPILGIHKVNKLSIRDIRDKWEEKFVKVFKSKGGEPKPFLVFNQNTDKKFKHCNTPYQVEDYTKTVEADLYNALTFYNLQCAFSNLGSVIRKSGKFIDIYKTIEEELKSDQKVLGRWFVTEVRHNFFADLYTNELLCTKTYVGPKSKIDDDAE